MGDDRVRHAPGLRLDNVAYAGAAPGLVAGVLQVNVKIPDNAPTGDAVPVTLSIGGVDSPVANISIASSR